MPDSRFSPRTRRQTAGPEDRRLQADGREPASAETDAALSDTALTDIERADTERADTTDASLTLRLRQRDEAALSALYDRHAGAVFGVLCRLLGDAAAQEVLQDVFLRLWERPELFDPARGGLKTFLLVMARSRALDRLRRDHPTLPLFTETGVELPLPDTAPGPVGRSEDAQRRERIRAALSQLSAAHRETVERAFLSGQSREAISGAMNVPVGTVKSRLSYGLKHLRQVLGKEVETWLE